MIYKIVRMTLLVTLFLTITLPALELFNVHVPAYFSGVSTSISNFLNGTAAYIQNVRGLINQFIYAGSGDVGVGVFNGLIWASLFAPFFALGARITLVVIKHLF